MNSWFGCRVYSFTLLSSLRNWVKGKVTIKTLRNGASTNLNVPTSTHDKELFTRNKREEKKKPFDPIVPV